MRPTKAGRAEMIVPEKCPGCGRDNNGREASYYEEPEYASYECGTLINVYIDEVEIYEYGYCHGVDPDLLTDENEDDLCEAGRDRLDKWAAWARRFVRLQFPKRVRLLGWQEADDGCWRRRDAPLDRDTAQEGIKGREAAMRKLRMAGRCEHPLSSFIAPLPHSGWCHGVSPYVWRPKRFDLK